ncbi:MAG: helix-turn-helix domain-containing protein [Dissulfurispiraceae bacterium]|jgi:excisionase family DNA binding protein
MSKCEVTSYSEQQSATVKIKKPFTPKELAAYLNVKVHTVYVWVHLKKIPYCKAGHLLRFWQEDINNWLKSDKPVKAKPKPARVLKAKPRISEQAADIDAMVQRAHHEVMK